MEYTDDSVFIERRISLLETKIGQRKKSIRAMKQKMAEYQNEIERKKAENQRIIAHRDALANQLKAYRKAIQLSSKSQKTLLEYTKELFENENNLLYELEDQIEQSKEILEKVQKQAPTIRELLAQIETEIPDFKTDLLKFNFNDCLNTIYGNLNRRLLGSLKSAHFMEDQINEKKNERSKLMREVKMLTPPKVKMQLEAPTKSQYKKAPDSEFQNSKDFETVFIDKMFNKANNILERYQSSLDIIPSSQSPESTISRNAPVTMSRTPTATARRSPSNRRKSARKSINDYSKTPDGKNANLSPLSSRASARLTTVPIQATSSNTVNARPNRRSQRRQQYNSVNLSSLSSDQVRNIDADTANSYLLIKMSTLTDSISRLNVLLGRVNKANENMSVFRQQMTKKIEDAEKQTVSITPKSLPGVTNALKILNATKKKIQSEEAEVKALRIDIPEQWNGSPQGLLKWQNQLLEQKEKLENSIGQQIIKQENQLKDLKVFTKRRMNSLRKLKGEK